ncbi:MAG: gamma-glutamylcyclotransferase [Thermoanaerobacteraceae bacterium]|nr:gamma-glutamylcyclotransferase [Thermoanaerobacteraceae bacterium]
MDKGVVFVYGTLMEGFWNYEKILKPYVLKIDKAWVRGTLYHLPQGYPALTDGDGKVAGQLMECKQFGKVVALLDELEDYYGPGRDNLYERVTKEVFLSNGEKREAFAYIYSPARTKELERFGILVAGGDWRQYMKQRRKETLG